MAFLSFGLERLVVRFPETSALVRKRFSERRMLIVAPRLVESFGFVAAEGRDDVFQRVPERGFLVETTAPPFVEGALHPFLLAAVLFREFVPQLFRGVRIRGAAEVVVILKLDWGMFRRPAQDSMDVL